MKPVEEAAYRNQCYKKVKTERITRDIRENLRRRLLMNRNIYNKIYLKSSRVKRKFTKKGCLKIIKEFQEAKEMLLFMKKGKLLKVLV